MYLYNISLELLVLDISIDLLLLFLLLQLPSWLIFKKTHRERERESVNLC